MPNAVAKSTLLCILCLTMSGCSERKPRRWFKQLNWHPAAFFDDARTAALRDAIESGNPAEFDRLAAAGTDPRAVGRSNVTPLLAALLFHQEEMFLRLLELGADPNIPLTDDAGTKIWLRTGESVTSLTFRTLSDYYYRTVLTSGGDINYVNPNTGDSLLHQAALFEIATQAERVRCLIAGGVDLERQNNSGQTAVMAAADRGCFRAVLQLLNSGAGFRDIQGPERKNLTQIIARHGPADQIQDAQFRREYRQVTEWLKTHGLSAE